MGESTIVNPLKNRGKKTLLLQKQGTGTASLNDSIRNYKYLFVVVSYYNSGNPKYGQMLIPVDCIAVANDSVYAFSLLAEDGNATQKGASLYFPSETSVNVQYIYNNDRYVVIWGIS